MGRNSGGVITVTDSGVVVSKGSTESGYTKDMLKNIVGIEQKYRNNKDETLHIFTQDGKLVMSVGGQGNRVEFYPYLAPKDAILTHNHPNSIGRKGILKIGNSFSKEDIMTAVEMNVKEMRAVTPTYTFSIKRPKEGWNIGDAKSFKREYSKIYKSVDKEMRQYMSKRGSSKTSIERAMATFYHKVNTELAKKYGWDYTKKKG